MFCAKQTLVARNQLEQDQTFGFSPKFTQGHIIGLNEESDPSEDFSERQPSLVETIMFK